MKTGARRVWKSTASWETALFSTFRGPNAVSFIPAPLVSTAFVLYNENICANYTDVSNTLLYYMGHP